MPSSSRKQSGKQRAAPLDSAVRVRIGTSGWSYPHWREQFYPPGMRSADSLPFLATRFDTVEVNGTFYSLVTPEVVEAWRACVPAEFVFAVKASRYVTHMKKLGGGVAPLANFFAQGVLRLGATLGPILWQLPPNLPFSLDRARAFLDLLPRDVRAAERLARRHDERLTGRCALRAPDGRDSRLRHAFEVRHASWLGDEALQLLAEHDVALVAADTAGKHPASVERTASFAYVRLHGSRVLYGSRYTDAELDAWAKRIRAWAREGAPVFVYFDNDNRAFAPSDAERLGARVEGRDVAAWARRTKHDVEDRVDRYVGRRVMR
ncbi:MAG TPA: DUF72 domain-containing protein [Polyangiaceae bacterium]